jgi:hypothetical protein
MRVVGVASSLVQIMRSLGGTVGVALLGAYATIKLANLLGGGEQEIASLLRSEVVAAMTPEQLDFLRQELAETLRGMFLACTVVMAFASVLALRLGDVPVTGRWARGMRAARSEPEA